MGKTNYVGVDYSNGQANIDNENGIHYGIIPFNEISQAWSDESEAEYPPTCCPVCDTNLDDCEIGICPGCEEEIDPSLWDFMEPSSFYIQNKDYTAIQNLDDPAIFILKSKYFTYCQYCSPCAPGAGYLLNYTNEGVGIKTYCFGHDMFYDTEGEKAPYPVYSVKTGKLTKKGE